MKFYSEVKKDQERPTCPHCGKPMNKWVPPDTSSLSWGTPFIYICFNDDCPYFVKSWDWMRIHYNRSVAYRHAYNPATGKTLPIWFPSPSAGKDRIID